MLGICTIGSSLQVTKTHTVSGTVRELGMALTANRTHELFRIRVIGAPGHSAQLLANVVSPPEAPLPALQY